MEYSNKGYVLSFDSMKSTDLYIHYVELTSENSSPVKLEESYTASTCF